MGVVVAVDLIGPQRAASVRGLLWRATVLWRIGQFASGVVSWEAARRRLPSVAGAVEVRHALSVSDFLRAADVVEYVSLPSLADAATRTPQ